MSSNTGGYLLNHHFIRGLTRMKARIGLSMVIMLAMAIVRLRSNQLHLIRSLVEPVPLFQFQLSTDKSKRMD